MREKVLKEAARETVVPVRCGIGAKKRVARVPAKVEAIIGCPSR